MPSGSREGTPAAAISRASERSGGYASRASNPGSEMTSGIYALGCAEDRDDAINKVRAV
jgi:hypothetical protein